MTDKKERKTEAPPVETQRVDDRSEFAWTPLVDIHETSEAFVIEADMPGVDRKGVDVRIEKGLLTIEGRGTRRSVEGVRKLHEEFVPADYYRAFEVDEGIDEDGIEAVMTDGVLTVTLPRSQRAGARKIDVR